MKWLSGAVFLLIAAPVIFLSVLNIKTEVSTANIVALSREIETAHRPPIDFVQRSLAEGQESLVLSACQDDVSRSIVTLWIYLLNNSPANSRIDVEVGRGAISAVERRLACSPADGNAWLIRAEVLQRMKPDSPEVKASLQMSYRLAPAESWIMYPRFDFALSHLDFVQRELKNEFHADLQMLSQYAPPDILAANYVRANDKVRGMIVEILAHRPEARRVAVAENADRLGVSLRAKSCLEGRSLFKGGSELASPMFNSQGTCSAY